MPNRVPLLLLASLLAASCLTAHAIAGTDWQASPPIESEHLTESRGYRVSLPENYASNPDAHYPLLLLLDGQRYGDLVADNAIFLAKIGEIPEHIIVAVDSGNRLRDFTPTDSPDWEGDGGAGNFLAFLQKELLPQIEKDYRVARPHVIWGHSLGGLFAMYTLYAGPELFDACLVNDGSLDWDYAVTERLMQEFFERQASPRHFLYFNSSYMRPMDDPELRWLDRLTEMLAAKAPANLRWIYEPMPNESHASIPLVGSIRGLRALYEGYLAPETVMFAGLDAVVKHYDSIKGRVGAPDQIPEAVLNNFGYLMLFEATDEAVGAFELATQLYPQSTNAWDSLSDGYLEAGRTKEALVATDKCIALAIANGSVYLDDYQGKRAEILSRM
jgi:predicted alpha/beta superfamily hydrolase